MGTRGGKREGAGRKSRREEQKANKIFLKALGKIYGTKLDDKAKEAFIAELMKSERGKMFIAEHLFGKATNKVDAVIETIVEIDMSTWQ